MTRIQWREVAAGLVVVAFGGFVAVQSLDYGIGPIRRMQAGNFPLILGLAAMILGLAISSTGLLRSAPEDGSDQRVPIRPLVAVLAGVATFAVLLQQTGLVPAAAAAAAITATGDRDAGPRSVLGISLFMGLFAWLVFGFGFRLSVAAFAWGL